MAGVGSYLKKHTEALVKAGDLKSARVQFDGVSQAIIAVVRRFGTSGKTAVIPTDSAVANR